MHRRCPWRIDARLRDALVGSACRFRQVTAEIVLVLIAMAPLSIEFWRKASAQSPPTQTANSLRLRRPKSLRRRRLWVQSSIRDAANNQKIPIGATRLAAIGLGQVGHVSKNNEVFAWIPSAMRYSQSAVIKSRAMNWVGVDRLGCSIARARR